MTSLSRIPLDTEYAAALGRAFHNFIYLEWVVVWVIAKLNAEGFAGLTKPKTAGYLARKLTEAIDSASPPLSYNLRLQLAQFHASLVGAKHERDRLLHAHPYSTREGLQPLDRYHHWPIDRLIQAAARFEKLAMEGSDILYRDLAKERS